MSFAQYKSLLKDDDGTFKMDWIMMSTNLVGVAIVVAAAIQARTTGDIAEFSHEIVNASLF